MEEVTIKVPPWSLKRRIVTTVVLTGFILLASGFIGLGIYQIGIDTGRLSPSLTQQSLLKELMEDAAFVRAVTHAARRKTCVNNEKRFSLTYDAPLRLSKNESSDGMCTLLVTMHPTGVPSTVTITHENKSREELVLVYAQEYSSIQTDILSKTVYEISALHGLKKGVLTTQYVIEVAQNSSWIITYKPSSIVTDGNVLELVENFRVF